MAYTIPSDANVADAGNPAGDMNNAADMLGLISVLFGQLAGAGTNNDPAGNAANVTAMQALKSAASLAPGAAGTVLVSNGSSAKPTFQPIPSGLQLLTATGAVGSVGGTITAAMITTAISQGYQGFYLDPHYVWDMSGLVINGVSNFIIKSDMVGTIGWSGSTTHNTGYVKTDTSTPADGVQVYCSAPGTTNTQGIIFDGIVFVGSNPNSVVHFGGGQRQCKLRNCLVLNTNAMATTVATGSNGGTIANIATWGAGFGGNGVLDVNSIPASQPTSGTLLVAASGNTLAVVTYTGISGNSYTGCAYVCGSTVGTVTGAPTGGSAVTPIASGLALDTMLSPNNSENNEFSSSGLASTNGVGLAIDQPATGNQHANDTWFNGCVTAAGLYGILAFGGGGLIFSNWYDRSSPLYAACANFGAKLRFFGGEDYNPQATNGVDHIVANLNAITEFYGTNLTAATNTTLSISAGLFVARGGCRLSGTVSLTGGVLDISDTALQVGNLTVTGSGGTLLANARYSSPTSGFPNGPNTPPTVSSYTGTIVTANSGMHLCPPAVYAPGTLTTPQLTTTTVAALSAGNATTNSFVAPTSGAVLVTATLVGRGSAASCYTAFGLADHTGGTARGNMIQTEVSSSGQANLYTLVFPVTGLTPGTSYQFDLVGACTSGDTFTADVIAQSVAVGGSPTLGTAGQGGPVTMTVQAL